MTADGLILGTQPAESEWVGQVLKYWFEELGDAHWFEASRDVDGQIRTRFLALHEQLVNGHISPSASPRGMLAAIVVLDQFSRNMFRGTPRAYAADAQARQLAKAAIAQQLDLGLSATERQFLYLPFQHSENREDQARSVALYAQLGNEDWNSYALAHQALIDEFGRFPHRNAILGRQSTEEEKTRLTQPMGSF